MSEVNQELRDKMHQIQGMLEAIRKYHELED